ncbi:MAG: hypothetical protein PSX71_14855 [bacterium]|nr:hypothetical protein [bacterium]
MNANQRLLLAAAVLLVLVIAAGVWLRAAPGPDVATPPPAAPVAPVTTQMPVLPDSGVVATTLPGSDTALTPVVVTQPDAAQAMSEARLHGDSRAPALARSPERDPPSAADLASPENYQRYESRQNQRLYSAYVKAADDEIPRLQEQIRRARSEGIPEEEIRKGEEKLRRIQAMRDQLQADHPGTAAAASAP